MPTATPKPQLFSWKNMFFNGPTVAVVIGVGAMIYRQDAGLRRVEEAVIQEVSDRRSADKATQKVLEDIRDELVFLRSHYISYREMDALLKQMGKLNPELNMPVMTGR